MVSVGSRREMGDINDYDGKGDTDEGRCILYDLNLIMSKFFTTMLT